MAVFWLGVSMETKTLKLCEHYVKDSKGKYTDLVYFDENGAIVCWMLYSGVFNEWFSVPLSEIRRERPAMLDKFEIKILEEIIPSGDYSVVEAKADEQIDQDRDDKIGEAV